MARRGRTGTGFTPLTRTLIITLASFLKAHGGVQGACVTGMAQHSEREHIVLSEDGAQNPLSPSELGLCHCSPDAGSVLTGWKLMAESKSRLS